MSTRRFLAIIAVLLTAVCAFAEGTRTWQQTKFEEFEKGTSKGVAIRSDGTLELAPAFNAVTTTPSTYTWSIASDAEGNAYLASGSPARVYRLTPDGKSSVIFEAQELQAQSLVVSNKGVIYAATSPDGKVYRIEYRPAKHDEGEAKKANVDPNWTASVFYEPKTKYIWSLALDPEGRLYVATGDRGEIFRVERSGQGALFFKSDEAHIRTLTLDREGNLLAGSDGSGLVYRISPRGEAFVLYSAPKKEITALAVDKAGNIYAAGVGEKRAATTPVGTVMPPNLGAMMTTLPQAQPQPQPGTVTATPAPGAVPQMPPTFPLPGLGATGSEVYQIAPDGSPKRIWNSREDIVYALAFDRTGRLLAGTGNKGRIFAIRGEQEFTDFVKASANQVTGFAQAPSGGLYVSTSNLAKVFLLGDAPEKEGTYESDVFDARNFSRWGRVEVRGAGNFELWARSGNVDNPDRNWSPWKLVDLRKDVAPDVPPARFVQWRAVLLPGNPPPRIESVLVNYLPKNVAPVIEDVVVQVGARFNPPPRVPGGVQETVTVNVGSSPTPPAMQVAKFDAGMPAVKDRDSVAVRWAAHDDNDDQLMYALYYRGDNETNWKLLKDKITDKYFSFDSGLLPDGGYRVKVVASDSPSHSPEDALTDNRESPHFEIDTTPPRIDDLNAAVDNGELHITFRATDTFSVIRRAEYSVDAGDWQFVEPVGQLSDARSENYDFAMPLPGVAKATAESAKPAGTPIPTGKALSLRGGKKAKGADGPPPAASAAPVASAPGEHLVVVRVWDRFDNVATAKTLIHTTK
ncbi:MAG: hypothetical protein ACE14L_16040 [Terriglobales bacterium]